MKKNISSVNLAEIKIFSHEVFGNIRTLTNGNGETFFVGNDVAKALGYAKPQNALSAHVNNEDKGTAPIQGTAYETRVTIINESGLYALVLSSKLPQAKAFKRWVTSEVLPQIRKTGGYIPTRNARTGEALTESEVVEVANRIMQRTISRNNLPADDCLTATQVAERVNMDVTCLNHMLVDWGIQFWNGGRYKLTAKYADSGYAEERRFHFYGLNGQKKERRYMVWTPQGCEFIKSMFNC